MTLTASAIRSYLDCPRKYEFAYVELIRPDRQADALRFGSAYHHVQEELDAGKPWVNICREVADRCISEIETQQVLRLVAEHRRHYDDTFEVVATEDKFRVNVGGVECEGKIDRKIRLGRRVAVQEYKTSSEDIAPGSMYWRRLRIDIQAGLYELASGADLVLYDVCRKPTIKPRQVPTLDADGKKIVLDAAGQRVYTKQGKPRQTGDSKQGWVLQQRPETPSEYGDRLTADIRSRPEWYFQRQEINRLASDAADTVADVQAVDGLISLKQFPRNTSACTRFGTCCYFDLCSNGHRPADGAPAGFHVADTAHQELK